jgi:hypothetical protein
LRSKNSHPIHSKSKPLIPSAIFNFSSSQKARQCVAPLEHTDNIQNDDPSPLWKHGILSKIILYDLEIYFMSF